MFARASRIPPPSPGRLVPGAVDVLKLTGGSAAGGFELKPDQHEAWLEQWEHLQALLKTVAVAQPGALGWSILLEYEIAGRRKRLDCVLLTDVGIVAIEFKVGADAFESADRWQLHKYCWNLRDFHRESRGARIAPILVATNASRLSANAPLEFTDRCGVILDMICCGAATFGSAIDLAIRGLSQRGSGFAWIKLEPNGENMRKGIRNERVASRRSFILAEALRKAKVDEAGASKTSAFRRRTFGTRGKNT